MNPPENGDAWSHWISQIGSANHKAKPKKLKIKERKRPRPSSLIHLDTIGVTLDIRSSLCLHSPPPKWTEDETRPANTRERNILEKPLKPGELPIDNVRRRRIHQGFTSVNLSMLWSIYLDHLPFQHTIDFSCLLLNRCAYCALRSRSQDWKTASNGRRHISKSTTHFRHKRSSPVVLAAPRGGLRVTREDLRATHRQETWHQWPSIPGLHSCRS